MSVSQNMLNRYEMMSRSFFKAACKGATECPFCGAEIEYNDEETYSIPAKYYPLECHCILAVHEEAKDAKHREESDRSYSMRIEKSMIPDKYLTAKTDKDIGSYYFHGNVGVGKTYEACAVLIKAINAGMSALFVTTSQIARMSFDERESMLLKMRDADIVCIDDIGKNETGKWESSIAFTAIDERYKSGKPTIITGNYDLGQLATIICGSSNEETARSIVSRICEMTQYVEIAGSDRRLSHGN